MTSSCLYIVATPIGNRDDLSRRAIDVLQSVDIIAAEDTRHSRKLLDYYHIRTPLFALHEHNELRATKPIISRLDQGQSIAIIADAGTPLISDPGYRLVVAAQQQHYRIVPIPGACAAIAALCVAGLPTDRFIFEGFLPTTVGARKNRLKQLLTETRTMIFYESTHRIVASLADMANIFGSNRRAVLAKELTKTFETIRQDNLSLLLAWLTADPNRQKGEFVVIVAGADKTMTLIDSSGESEIRRILTVLLAELPLKQAVAITVKLTGCQRKLVYRLALDLKINH